VQWDIAFSKFAILPIYEYSRNSRTSNGAERANAAMISLVSVESIITDDKFIGGPCLLGEVIELRAHKS
jgi:hypothetical protein